MRAKEILQRYAQGERNFSGINLRGLSFQGANLSGADFSGTDIRGTNFHGAILQGVNFVGAKAGLQKRWLVGFLVLCFSIGYISSYVLGFAVELSGYIFDSKYIGVYRIATWLSLISIVISYVFIFYKGVKFDGATALIFLGFISGAIAISGDSSVAVAFTVVFANIFSVIFAIILFALIDINSERRFVLFLACTGLGLGTLRGITNPIIGYGSFIVIIINAYLAIRAIQKEHPRDIFVRNIALALAAFGGTNFYNADLSGADFTGATLKSTDFRPKSLNHTNLQNSQKLNLARLGKTLLANRAVRDLLITGQGEGKDYSAANLHGAYLRGANLKEANLRQADLSGACLAYANLEGANLTQANAVATDFTCATLTGACIEAWNIESSTQLEEVDCAYLYLLNNHLERRPSSGVFQEGEFSKLFSEVMDTVDFIFRNGVDWKAFIAAFRQVQVENEETPLEIQSIENKGDGVVVVRVKVDEEANKEKIHRGFMEIYEVRLRELEASYRRELEAKDREIILHHQRYTDMMEITKSLANRPIHVENTLMNNSNDQSRSFNVGNVGGDFKPIGAPILADGATISGTVAETINQLSPTSEPDKPGIKELLEQLQGAVKDLPEADREEALQQVQGLAEAAQNPQSADMQKKAKKAIGFLKVISEGLEPASKLVEAGK